MKMDMQLHASDFVSVVVSPRSHLVKNHEFLSITNESQSRTLESQFKKQ